MKFETALSIARQIAVAKDAEVTALTYWVGAEEWDASFSSGIRVSYVRINSTRKPIEEYLKTYEKHEFISK